MMCTDHARCASRLLCTQRDCPNGVLEFSVLFSISFRRFVSLAPRRPTPWCANTRTHARTFRTHEGHQHGSGESSTSEMREQLYQMGAVAKNTAEHSSSASLSAKLPPQLPPRDGGHYGTHQQNLPTVSERAKLAATRTTRVALCVRLLMMLEYREINTQRVGFFHSQPDYDEEVKVKPFFRGPSKTDKNRKKYGGLLSNRQLVTIRSITTSNSFMTAQSPKIRTTVDSAPACPNSMPPAKRRRPNRPPSRSSPSALPRLPFRSGCPSRICSR